MKGQKITGRERRGWRMRTIENERTVVDIIAWPHNIPWEGRYQTTSVIHKGACKLILSSEVFHDASKANTAYKRFSRRMMKEGLEPPRVVFRNMVSQASKNVFCILTTRESVFNSACEIGKFYIVDSGREDKRRICAILLREENEVSEEKVI